MVAVNCCVVPAAIVAAGGATVTVLTGTSATETCAAADCPSMVAVTATGPPAATPVMRPVWSTVTMPMLALDHCTGRSVISRPCASKPRAVSVLVRLTPTVAVAGSTVTRASGTGRVVIVEEPSLPCAAATISTAPPLVTALTRPVELTATCPSLALCQVKLLTSFIGPAHE